MNLRHRDQVLLSEDYACLKGESCLQSLELPFPYELVIERAAAAFVQDLEVHEEVCNLAQTTPEKQKRMNAPKKNEHMVHFSWYNRVPSECSLWDSTSICAGPRKRGPSKAKFTDPKSHDAHVYPRRIAEKSAVDHDSRICDWELSWSTAQLVRHDTQRPAAIRHLLNTPSSHSPRFKTLHPPRLSYHRCICHTLLFHPRLESEHTLQWARIGC